MPLALTLSEKIIRGVAQLGSAPYWGCGGRRFKSCHSDQFFPFYFWLNSLCGFVFCYLHALCRFSEFLCLNAAISILFKKRQYAMKNNRLIRFASYASVAVALVLLLIKLYGWWVTDSVSILASLLDSTFDLVASLMIMVAVHISQVPADKEHRFGHGKAEPLAGLGQSVFIAGSALYLMVYALNHLWLGKALQVPEVGLWVMLVSLSLTISLVLFQRYVARKTDSLAIHSDSLHYLSDIFSNLLVIVGLVLSQWQWLDPVLAMIISLWILRSAIEIALKSGHQLLDHELPDALRQQIQQIILATPHVRGFNDLRSYRSGPNRFVQFDLEMDDDLTLVESHAISEQVTERLKAEIEHLDVMIHQEPVSLRHDDSHHTWGCD